MLILTRRVNEATEIKDTRRDEHIATVLIMDIRGGLVRMGWEADKHIQVLRDNALQVRYGRSANDRISLPRTLLESIAFEHRDTDKFHNALRELKTVIGEGR